VLHESESLLQSTIKKYNLGSNYEWLYDRTRKVSEVLRNQTLREVLLAPSSRMRPSNSSLRLAAKARVPAYQMAVDAYSALLEIESLDSRTLHDLFERSLVANLEDWQKFEMATAFAVTEALSAATGIDPVFQVSLLYAGLFAQVADFDIYWQYKIYPREDSELDISERLEKEILECIGKELNASRADIAVKYRPSDEVISLIECKWIQSSNSLQSALISAASQLTQYCRDLQPGNLSKAIELLSHSVISVASRYDYPEKINAECKTFFTDFDGIDTGSLLKWSKSLFTNLNSKSSY
jgi:hypothetical protein